ncbi:alpha/beta hydrolase [Amantichitinum ursilacus]|uniref:Ferri-bacillibactin esterase BesA n=1 Tax=Amantichitinum ursilacus TaxID=857265 RepID=A0A0N0GPS1_9NEIS|nr:alpha/beta hydrolase [Amantichitinum ursilacus]KPC53761.1 Ferri-bacillibactin esterase BesA [Amantichitinum ursilacus]
MRALQLLGLAVALAHGVAVAKPSPDQMLMNAPVLRQASAYQFSSFDLDSADGQRHYRIWLGQPGRVNAQTPVLYLLDGNAAMTALDLPLLNQLAQRPAPPVLVALGYATPQRIDRNGRTMDYTPRVGNGEQHDPLTNLPSGGADAFLDLLRTRIQPQVNQRLHITPQQTALWGHSYGGLLVLHTLFTQPTLFTRYAAASPSLWWHDGAVVAEWPGLAQRLHGTTPSVLLMRGDAEPASPTTASTAGVAADAAAKALVQSLQQIDGLQLQYQTFPGLSHGPMLPASLRATLDWISAGTGP